MDLVQVAGSSRQTVKSPCRVLLRWLTPPAQLAPTVPYLYRLDVAKKGGHLLGMPPPLVPPMDLCLPK